MKDRFAEIRENKSKWVVVAGICYVRFIESFGMRSYIIARGPKMSDWRDGVR